jgi:hypothetical protein
MDLERLSERRLTTAHPVHRLDVERVQLVDHVLTVDVQPRSLGLRQAGPHASHSIGIVVERPR